MDSIVRILHIEDSDKDAELIHALLSESLACMMVRVDNRSDFINALTQTVFDLILCDYNLPSFDGKSALEISLKQAPHVPFIYVSGTLGEEKAVDALKMGATDYVLKSRMERLIPAVSRALRESEERKTRQALEERLFRAQRMESIGILAGGIAHDFNNILGIILGHASIIERFSPGADKVSGSAQAIMKASRRGAIVVQQLLAFARKNEVVLQPVSVNDVIKETVLLFNETFPKTITITMQLQEHLPLILGDSTQIHQVLINLCVNARDAMPDGGILSIATTEVSGESLTPKFFKAQSSKYVVVEVADTGIGMDGETRSHIFEPFFTTKKEEKGSGLGLAVAFGIVEKHEGFIDVVTEIGKGTNFSIYFPVKPPTKNVPIEEERTNGRNAEGTETLLIVEDEEMLRELLADVLMGSGYNVMIAANGAEAIEFYQKEFSRIDLVICDFGLPKFDGHEVFQRMKKINPSVKFILASGYIESKEKSEIMKAEANAFIQKPYLPTALLGTIREVLISA